MKAMASALARKSHICSKGGGRGRGDKNERVWPRETRSLAASTVRPLRLLPCSESNQRRHRRRGLDTWCVILAEAFSCLALYHFDGLTFTRRGRGRRRPRSWGEGKGEI